MELIPIKKVDIADPIWALAKLQADKSIFKFKVGAVLLSKKNKVISLGFNKSKTHPKFGSKPPYNTLHAEGDAIAKAVCLGMIDQVRKIYIYRKNSRNCKPCPSCLNLIKAYKIKEVYYSYAENDRPNRQKI